MIRAVVASALALALAAPALALAQDAPAPDMTKMTCGQMMEMQGKSMVKHGQTLQKAGKHALEMVKYMKKSKTLRADAGNRQRGGRHMVAMGKKMESEGKFLLKESKKKQHTHTMADAMAEMVKIPGEVRAKWATRAKEIGAEFQEWGNEMIKHGKMMEEMTAKMAEAKAPEAGSPAAPASPAAAEKKE